MGRHGARGVHGERHRGALVVGEVGDHVDVSVSEGEEEGFEATVEHGSENTYKGSPTNPEALADQSGTSFYYLEPNPAVVLPSSRRCVSRRSFRIRLRVPRKRKVRSATVYVGRKRVAVRRGKRLTSPVDLRGLPKGRFKVTIKLRLRNGRTLTSHRRYRTCTPKKR